MVEPPFRTITNRLIIENLSSLLVKDDGYSIVERSQMDMLNKIYYSYLSNIKLIILNNKYIRETGFELFEMEWKNYKIDIQQTVEDLVSKPFLLIPFNLEDIIEDYPKILRIQKTEVDGFKSNLLIFMSLHDLKCKIYKEKDIIRNNFPLKLGGFDLELGQSYNLTNIGLEIYPCKMRFSTSKNLLNYILLIYQNHLYFALPELKDSSFAIIKYKFALRHLEAQVDRSDPRILNIIVKDKNNYIDISMYYEDVNKTTSVKKSLEEQRKSSRNTEYLLLDSYFDDLISKWKF